jgi:CheY-like chemotaxis protein
MEYNYTFLLIEDNVIDQIITSHILKRELSASEINIVNNGKEAISWIKTNKCNLNQSLIILSDIEMPVMNGFQFLSKFDKLSDELKKETQIFMLSSTLCINEIKKGKRNPYVEDVFSKPLPIERFISHICPGQRLPA